ncbi:MAG: hypothetical protein VB048_05165 [Bacteroidaceae bacterium]|nr:hypothetical protein [Bacteroidaceae bacterium]
MVVRKFPIYGLIINFILLLISCNSKENVFYSKIKANDDCIIACDITYNNKETITVVLEKFKITSLSSKYNQLIDDKVIIKSIKSNNPIEVSRNLYQELYARQVINQYRVDSLLNKNGEEAFLFNQNNERLLNPHALVNETLMEQLYIIKKLFDKKILLKQDCESGYYYVIH